MWQFVFAQYKPRRRLLDKQGQLLWNKGIVREPLAVVTKHDSIWS